MFVYTFVISAFLVCSFYVAHIFGLLKDYRKIYLFTIAGSLIVGVFWDMVAIYFQIWAFMPSEILGIYIGNLPIEEYLFIIATAVFFTTTTLMWVEMEE